MKENKKMLQGIVTVIVRVSDISKATQWYQDKLGLALVWVDPNTSLVVLETGRETSLTLWQIDKKIEHNREKAAFPIFSTQSTVPARKELKERRVSVGEVVADDAVKFFRFYDPDGNVLEACQAHG